MKKSTLELLFCTAVFGLITASANSSPIVFNGIDPGANSTDPRPNSITAASDFDTAAGVLGPVNIIDFEAAPVGFFFSSLLIAPGVTLDTTSEQYISNTSIAPDRLFGYNTTVGGSNFLQMANTITFTFGTPIQAFGFYISGVQANGETITFSDGSSQTVNIPNPGSGVQFLGFTDANQQISSVIVYAASDAVGIDDVRFVDSVPEPTSSVLVVLGLLGVAFGRSRSRASTRSLPLDAQNGKN
ncbi:MAG: PEP-CTERM sorting domain-containing protein [Verrucomicrobiota bacterium]|jgi:hypothetical protein